MIFLANIPLARLSLRGHPESTTASELVGVGSRSSEGIGVNGSIAVGSGSKIQLCCRCASSSIRRCQGGTTTARSVASESTTTSVPASRGLTSTLELVRIHDLAGRLGRLVLSKHGCRSLGWALQKNLIFFVVTNWGRSLVNRQ